jgi:hypothetical protein
MAGAIPTTHAELTTLIAPLAISVPTVEVTWTIWTHNSDTGETDQVIEGCSTYAADEYLAMLDCPRALRRMLADNQHLCFRQEPYERHLVPRVAVEVLEAR